MNSLINLQHYHILLNKYKNNIFILNSPAGGCSLSSCSNLPCHLSLMLSLLLLTSLPLSLLLTLPLTIQHFLPSMNKKITTPYNEGGITWLPWHLHFIVMMLHIYGVLVSLSLFCCWFLLMVLSFCCYRSCCLHI